MSVSVAARLFSMWLFRVGWTECRRGHRVLKVLPVRTLYEASDAIRKAHSENHGSRLSFPSANPDNPEIL
jgi:hypothetical protein